jgi:resuscitation-promoting factor RpfB
MTIHFSKFDTKAWSFVVAGLLVLAALLCFFVWKNNAEAAGVDGARLITIHDKNNQKVIVTKQRTVGDALDQANIKLQPYDSVDPGVNTKLAASSYHINIYRAQPVLVIDGNARQTVMTPYDTPKQIAASAKRPLYDEDTTTLNQSDDILSSAGTGLQLVVDRATKFNLVLYGKVIEARTQAATVGDMMKDKDITLKPEDTLSVPASTLITPELKVEIWRNGKQTINEEQPVAFPIQHIQDADQPVGYKAVKTAGVLGKKNVTFEVDMQNGVEVSRRVIQEVVTLQPQQQVEVVGSKPSFSGSFADALAKLRSCEGSYTSNTGNGYYGAYQYDVSTWGGYGGYTYASDAPPAVQDQKVWETYQRRGWSPWPSCGANLPDTYR